jgi:hypothetical protein
MRVEQWHFYVAGAAILLLALIAMGQENVPNKPFGPHEVTVKVEFPPEAAKIAARLDQISLEAMDRLFMHAWIQGIAFGVCLSLPLLVVLGWDAITRRRP